MPKATSRPYTCSICGQKFTRGGLNAHQAKHEREQARAFGPINDGDEVIFTNCAGSRHPAVVVSHSDRALRIRRTDRTDEHAWAVFTVGYDEVQRVQTVAQ